MTTYQSVVFLQDDDAREVVDALFNVEGVTAHGMTAESVAAAAEYLSQWDYADEIESTDDLGAGTDDAIVFVDGGEYVITANLGLSYIGLSRVVRA